MLRIYSVCLEVTRSCRPVADAIAEVDRDLARQLRKASSSVTLNVSEGSGNRGGNRRLKYEYALGSARETRAVLQVADALGYWGLDPSLDDRLDHIIGTLVKVVR